MNSSALSDNSHPADHHDLTDRSVTTVHILDRADDPNRCISPGSAGVMQRLHFCLS